MLRVPLTRDHLSVISGITGAGQLLGAVQARAFKGRDAVRFLQHRQCQLSGRLPIIWDGAPIHHDSKVTSFVAETAGQICLEPLPGYAPDLNPAEGGWDQLKYVEMKNVTSPDQAELRHDCV